MPTVTELEESIRALEHQQEVARRLRAGSQGQRMLLAALTGWGQREDKQRALEAGFDHHLTKPVDGPRLDAVIAMASAAEQA